MKRISSNIIVERYLVGEEGLFKSMHFLKVDNFLFNQCLSSLIGIWHARTTVIGAFSRNLKFFRILFSNQTLSNFL